MNNSLLSSHHSDFPSCRGNGSVIAVSLRCKPHGMKFALPKYTIGVPSVHSAVQPSPPSKLRTFPHPKRHPTPTSVRFSLLPDSHEPVPAGLRVGSFRMKGTVPCVVFCHCRLSLSTVSSRITRHTAHVSALRSFSWLNGAPLYPAQTLFTHSSVDGNLGC